MNDPMQKRINEQLDREATELEFHYAARLSRQRAILRSGHTRSNSRRVQAAFRWSAVAASTLIAVVLLSQVLLTQSPGDVGAVQEAAIDIDLLQSEDFEVAENLEFYLWLDGQLAEGDAG